jgi:hypothetical protein
VPAWCFVVHGLNDAVELHELSAPQAHLGLQAACCSSHVLPLPLCCWHHTQICNAISSEFSNFSLTDFMLFTVQAVLLLCLCCFALFVQRASSNVQL